MSDDAYAVCRYIRHYRQKNGYAIERGMLGVSPEFVDLLEKNGVIETLPAFEGGPKNRVVLTDKGLRMAER